ncbi:hypothetical protein M0638_26215 [Roseomonas sp. NAR14]|uniref:Uncharacterized protein n=1 Tax=Roseomonas acroporae TaxID=2937791 RepID=A0A9X1YFC7_9PROT|nr:hypothetical protein [Roseomonas acroporae]MCK8787853.1 hypothetical protein [Roseomonas acroporae]
MTNLPTIAELRRTALDAIAMARGLSPHDQLAPLWVVLRVREAAERLVILDRDAAALPDPAERDAARRAAEDVRRAFALLTRPAAP